MKKTFSYLIIILLLTTCSRNDDTETSEKPLTTENVDIQLTNVNFGLNDIDFLDKNIGFVVDSQGRILKTESSGANWNLLYESNYELLDIQFITQQYGYVLAKVQNEQSYFLLKTIDYGETFTEISIPNGSDLTKLYFTDNNTGFVLGNNQ